MSPRRNEEDAGGNRKRSDLRPSGSFRFSLSSLSLCLRAMRRRATDKVCVEGFLDQ